VRFLICNALLACLDGNGACRNLRCSAIGIGLYLPCIVQRFDRCITFIKRGFLRFQFSDAAIELAFERHLYSRHIKYQRINIIHKCPLCPGRRSDKHDYSDIPKQYKLPPAESCTADTVMGAPVCAEAGIGMIIGAFAGSGKSPVVASVAPILTYATLVHHTSTDCDVAGIVALPAVPVYEVFVALPYIGLRMTKSNEPAMITLRRN